MHRPIKHVYVCQRFHKEAAWRREDPTLQAHKSGFCWSTLACGQSLLNGENNSWVLWGLFNHPFLLRLNGTAEPQSVKRSSAESRTLYSMMFLISLVHFLFFLEILTTVTKIVRHTSSGICLLKTIFILRTVIIVGKTRGGMLYISTSRLS